MTRVDVTFFSGGEQVSGWFFEGSGEGPRPAIVFCPGYTGTKYNASYQLYIQAFNQEGYSVLAIDYRGWGDSAGERGALLPLEQVEDIRCALDYLELREDVDSARLALFGVSFGGGNATYVAAIDGRVRSLVAVSAVADGTSWLRAMRREWEWQDFLDRIHQYRRDRVVSGKSQWVDPTEEVMLSTPERRQTRVKGDIPADKVPNRTRLECAEAILRFRPVDLAGRIGCAGLWFSVERDSVVPPEHSRALYDAAPDPKRLVHLPGRDHYAAYVRDRGTILGESLAWYREHLVARASGVASCGSGTLY